MAVLPDLVRPGLRVVFCGTAAGTASARAGAYYAGPGNRFWETLRVTGLTPVLLGREPLAAPRRRLPVAPLTFYILRAMRAPSRHTVREWHQSMPAEHGNCFKQQLLPSL
ncbi:MAG TPA: uracil-DNA glycosylase family protein [Solirubrobacterales bacterium]|nr:uracil-DNA glycosylase family protein [Solirubrobacterales bacterium]